MLKCLASVTGFPQLFVSVVYFSTDSHAAEFKFADTFAGIQLTFPDGSAKLYPDPKKWAFTFWPGTQWPDSYGDGTNWLAGNDEAQTYVTPLMTKVKGKPVPVNLRYDPFTIQPDGLHIKAALLTADQQQAYQVGGYRRFGSGMLLSRQSFTYGKIRMVAKLPAARGSWATLWLLPDTHQWPPEIDIMEGMAWGPHAQEVHSGILTSKAENATYADWFDVGVDLSQGFHEYGLDWTKGTMTGYVDGKAIWTRPTPASMKQNMYLIINLAVGGKWPFNELSVMPIDDRSTERLTRGSDLIQGDYPAEMILRSITVQAP